MSIDNVLRSKHRTLQQLVANQEVEIESLKSEIIRLQSNLESLEKEAELAIIDSLTGLPNRRAFDRAFGRVTSELGFEGDRRKTGLVKSVGLLFVDVNKFKLINDTLGHEVGDQVLVVIASVLRESFTRDSDLVSRFAGDEFVVMLPRVSIEDLERLASELKSAIKKADYNFSGEQEVEVSVSIGISLAENQEEAKDLLGRADTSMYKEKKGGE